MKAAVGAVLVLLVGAAAGCLFGPPKPSTRYEEKTYIAVVPSGIAAANNTPETFYLVVVAGHENARRISGDPKDERSTCTSVQTFSYDIDTQTVRYDPAEHALDTSVLRVLVLADHWGVRVGPDGVTSGCPTKQLFLPFDGRANVADRIRDDVPLRFVVEAQNGFLSYNGTYFVPMGQKIHVNFTRLAESLEATYYVTGDFEVTVVGAWPKANVETVANTNKD